MQAKHCVLPNYVLDSLPYSYRPEVKAMTAIITDVKYRMSLAVIRDLGAAGVRVIVCHKDDQDGSPPLGFYSKYTAQRHIFSADGYEDRLFSLCRQISESDGRRVALLPVGAATLAMLAVSDTRERFSHVSGFTIPTSEQLTLLNDKGRVAELAASLDIPVPRSYTKHEDEPIGSFISRIPLPCVVKPRWGEGLGLTASMRYIIANTPEDLSNSYTKFSELAGEPPLVQEYLPGAAFGCSILAQNGEIVTKICHRRVREFPTSGGPSTCCDAISDPLLEDTAASLASAVGFTGLAMFEFKNDTEGTPRLLEINPRIWGSYPLTRIAKTGFSYAWYVSSANAGNPDKPLAFPPQHEIKPRRMIFFPSDIASASDYFRKGNKKLAFSAVLDFLRPGAKDGLFEWRDARPALRYWKSLLRKKQQK